ncbi:hypothetical protein ACQKGI_16510 [Peribacillus muralis]|uniref:hypothetical protein n=1 Tax=Peribacillus muralis TaxID=264697 RepID=UPI00381CA2BC
MNQLTGVETRNLKLLGLILGSFLPSFFYLSCMSINWVQSPFPSWPLLSLRQLIVKKPRKKVNGQALQVTYA